MINFSKNFKEASNNFFFFFSTPKGNKTNLMGGAVVVAQLLKRPTTSQLLLHSLELAKLLTIGLSFVDGPNIWMWVILTIENYNIFA